MKRWFVIAIALMAISAPAFANLVVNGDFSAGETGWTRWSAPWGSGYVWDTSGGVGRLQTGNGSFGWVQAISVTPGTQYTITASWKANNQGGTWNEILFFNDDGRGVYDQLDAPLNSSILAKVDGWGMNPPQSFDWMDPFGGSQWFPSGPHSNTIVATGTTMFVGLKTGASGGVTEAFFDNIAVNAVPEPASILALLAGLGGLVIRRKR